MRQTSHLCLIESANGRPVIIRTGRKPLITLTQPKELMV